MRSTPEPAGEACPIGGTRWDFGWDLDGDGSLGTDEVRSGFTQCDVAPGSCEVTEIEGGKRIDCADGTSATVRDGVAGDEGESGYAILVAVQAEPPGPNCLAGGSRVLAGLDRDRDGLLSEPEATSTAYVCHGLAPDGHMLTRLDPEEPGAACALGGIAVRAGLDADDDAILQDDEIAVTVVVCNGEPWQLHGVVEGDVHIVNSIDAALLEGATEITGELVVDGRLLTTVDLPSLTEVGGLARFWADGLSHLGLPALSTLAAVQIDAPLDTLDLGALTTVSGMLVVADTHLTDLGIDTLASGPLGLLEVAGNDQLVRLPDFPDVVGEFFFVHLQDNPALEASPLMPTLGVAAEVTVLGAHDALPDLSGLASATTIGLLRVEGATGMTSLGLTSARDIPQFIVVDNPSLPQCLVDQLIDQLDRPPNLLDVRGNDEQATCD